MRHSEPLGNTRSMLGAYFVEFLKFSLFLISERLERLLILIKEVCQLFSIYFEFFCGNILITNKSFPRIVHKAPADLENPPVASKIPNRAKYFVIPQKAEVLVREELMQVSS